MGRGLAIAGWELRAEAGSGREYPAILPASIGVVDVFTERPLVYQKEGAGYVLYSVVVDGVDNGGKSRKESGAKKEWDIVWRVK